MSIKDSGLKERRRCKSMRKILLIRPAKGGFPEIRGKNRNLCPDTNHTSVVPYWPLKFLEKKEKENHWLYIPKITYFCGSVNLTSHSWIIYSV